MERRDYPFIGATFIRFSAYFIVSAIVVTAIVLSLDYQGYLFERSRSQDRESLRLSLASKSIARDLRKVISDLRVLSKLQLLREYLKNESPATRTRLENAFVNIGESARIYDQIRYIDAFGLEKVRVNFHDGTASPVPAALLQDKSNRYYVSDTLKLGVGEIYVSPLDLNIEQGEIERPFKPMIRIATPVYSPSGQLKGMIVLNYLAEELLNDYRDLMAGSWGVATIVNARGYWVYSPNKKDEWGFMFGRQDSFAHRYPVAWRDILQHDAGTVTTPAGLFIFATARPYGPGTSNDLNVANGNITERYWKLIERVPQSLLSYSSLRALDKRWGELLGLWILVGVLSLLLAILRSNYAAKSKALRGSENRLAEAQQLAHIGNWVWDIPTSKINWSVETYNIFGLSPEKNIDFDTYMTLVHPEDRGAVNQAIETALQHGPAYDMDHRIVRADNTERTVHERGTVTFDKSGAPVRMFGTIQDITERKTTEEKLRESEQRFRQLAENINEVFWLTEWPQNRVVYISPAFERVWGFATQHLYEDPMAWTQSIVAEDRSRVEQLFLQSVGGGGYDVTYRILRADGEVRWIHDRAFLIRNQQGEVYRIAGVAIDITSRIHAEQELQDYKAHLEDLVAERTAELQASNRELESFNHSLAHDLRTPLRAVTSFSQILSEEAGSKLTATEQDHLSRITNAGKHMASLLDGISELGRISRSKLKMRTLDLSAIARRVINQLRQAQPQRPVKVHVMPRLQATGDERLVTMVIRNLLENAWKNVSESTEAHIELGAISEPEKGATVYYVRDNGIGFDMKHAAHLFEPFQYLYKDDKPLGTGIALAAVHRIIQRHKGRIWAEAGENIGETFYFTLAKSGQDISKSIPAPQTAEPEI